MSIIVNLQISVKPELRADFMSDFGEIVSVTRAIDACNWLYVTTNDETGKIEVVAHWNSREEYDEVRINPLLRDHAIFIGYAPFDNPRYSIAVIVENGESGGRVAGPIAKKVLENLLNDF